VYRDAAEVSGVALYFATMDVLDPDGPHMTVEQRWLASPSNH
jgi:hypothetical protein